MNELKRIAADPARVAMMRVKNSMAYAKRNPEIVAQRLRVWKRLTKYGVTQEWYDRKQAEQGGVCAICKGPQVYKGQVRQFDVDHHHTANKVRGLLCGHCNKAIGLFKDDPKLLLAAAAYLESYL